jgi:hypothetical protein
VPRLAVGAGDRGGAPADRGDLREAGVDATGRADIGSPVTCLIDGLRQFAATDVVLLANSEPGWKDTENLAEQVRTELGLCVTEVHISEVAVAA